MPPQPLVFRPPWRPWWPRVVPFAALVVVALVGASIKSSISATDIAIGVAMVGALGAFVWWIGAVVRKRVRLEFDRWTMTVVPLIGRTRTVDVREVARVRHRIDRGVESFGVRMKGESWWREFAVPVGMVGDRAASEALLVRLATVPGLDADRFTADALEAWREWLRASGTDPASYPAAATSSDGEPEIPAPYA